MELFGHGLGHKFFFPLILVFGGKRDILLAVKSEFLFDDSIGFSRCFAKDHFINDIITDFVNGFGKIFSRDFF